MHPSPATSIPRQSQNSRHPHPFPDAITPSLASRDITLRALLILVTASVWLTIHHAPPRSSIPAIAVIPLANRTGLSDLDAPADSLTEGLIRGLSDTGLLKVYGRATMFSFRGQERNAREVGRNLSANVVVTGHVDRPGPNLALDIEISDVRDGAVLFSYRYLLGPDPWMQVQADLVRDTLNALGADPGEKGAGLISPPSLNPQAYRAFITGESQSRHFTPATLLAAMASFERAVQLDPKFAFAWAELAEDETSTEGIYFDDPKKWMPKARQAAQEALRFNPSLDNSKATVALVDLVYDWKIPEANAALATPHLKRIALSSFSCAAHLFHETGRTRRAEEEVRDALTFDPRNPSLICELGCVAYYNGHYEEAIRSFQDAVRLDPQSAVSVWGLGRTLSMQGKYSEALSTHKPNIPALRMGTNPLNTTAERGFASASMGDRQTAFKCLDQLRAPAPASYVDSYLLATVYLGLKDFDNAFLMLNRAVDQKSAFAIFGDFDDPIGKALAMSCPVLSRPCNASGPTSRGQTVLPFVWPGRELTASRRTDAAAAILAAVKLYPCCPPEEARRGESCPPEPHPHLLEVNSAVSFHRHLRGADQTRHRSRHHDLAGSPCPVPGNRPPSKAAGHTKPLARPWPNR